VFEIINAGGWVMWPILVCSVLSMAIIVERFVTLRRGAVIPPTLVAQVWQLAKSKQIDDKRLELLRKNSPMGRILAAGLINVRQDRETMKTSIEEVANQVVHELERYLNTLGTIAEITPLLGLLGTVTGIISMLAAVGEGGLGDPSVLSSGLAEALITTAAGLTVAIPTFVFYRYFRGLVDALVISMEQEALKLIDVLQNDRGAARS